MKNVKKNLKEEVKWNGTGGGREGGRRKSAAEEGGSELTQEDIMYEKKTQKQEYSVCMTDVDISLP